MEIGSSPRPETLETTATRLPVDNQSKKLNEARCGPKPKDDVLMLKYFTYRGLRPLGRVIRSFSNPTIKRNSQTKYSNQSVQTNHERLLRPAIKTWLVLEEETAEARTNHNQIHQF